VLFGVDLLSSVPAEADMKKTSPTERTMRKLRDLGYLVSKAEHWNQFARQTFDLFGFIDVAALGIDESGVLAVQATTTENQSKRVTKILGLESAKRWLDCGNRIEVWGWKKSAKTKKWEVTRTPVTLEEFRNAGSALPPLPCLPGDLAAPLQGKEHAGAVS
jgi:hypothetical protein